MRARLLLVVLTAAVLTACASGGETTTPAATPAATPARSSSAESVELTIFAAASLGSALEQVTAAYEAAHPGTTLVISADSSAALATQIQQGAPADVFLSADTTNPQKLVDSADTAGAPVAFAGNKLCIVVPAGNPGGVAAAIELGRAGLAVIAAGDEVPITTYARQLVANLAQLPDAPAGFEAAYAANIVSREDNVRSVLTKIELGEGDAAIVYVTDAAASDGVETVEVPDAANVRASYAGVVVKASPHQAAAAAFLDWLVGSDGQAILATFGFLPPSA